MALYRTIQQVAEKFPLVTSPILVGERVWSVLAVENQDSLLDAVDELEHLPYGFLLWESAVGLARHVNENPELVAGKRVLELGCGVGLAGLVAAAVGAIVWQTDHQPGVLALAGENGERNGIVGVERFLADWSQWNRVEKYDVLLGADILYVRGMHYFLETIFRRNLAPGGRLLIADPVRPQSMEFMAHLEKSGWRIDLQTRQVQIEGGGSDSGPVEVALMLAWPT